MAGKRKTKAGKKIAAESGRKERFSDSVYETVEILLAAVRKKAEMLLNDEEMLAGVKITDLTSAVNAMYDKGVADDGGSDNIITFSLPDEVRKYVK